MHFYLDDITLGDTVQNLIGEIKKFQKEALGIGLDLNHTKCEIIGLTYESSGLHYFKPSMAATILLGCLFTMTVFFQFSILIVLICQQCQKD